MDAPDVSPNRGWSMPSKNYWCDLVPEPYAPLKPYGKSNEGNNKPAPAWKTPEKTYKHWKQPGRKWRTSKQEVIFFDDCEDDAFSGEQDSRDSFLRTSTPVRELYENCADNLSSFDKQFGNGYRCWKDHLQISPAKNKLKVRGALFPDEFVSGQFVMRQHEKKQYIENHSLPILNHCFVNLLINGPSPLICDSNAHEDNVNHWKSKCFCLPNCHCTSMNMKERVTLPIGYKYDENGLITSTTSCVSVRNLQKDPLCIYTN